MPIAKIKLDMDTKGFIRALGRKGNDLQIAAAEAVNESAEQIDEVYQKRLKRKQKIKTKFTLNSIKIFKANPIRRSGEPRLLSKINAIIGVRKMKKGKDHYLADLEKGSVNRGNPLTLGKVPVPLNTARTAKSENRPIAGPNRLTKGEPQKLTLGGKPFGTRGDRFTNRRRWGALYAQKKSGYNRLQGDVRKPFFFIGNDNDQGIYKLVGRIFRKIRNLDQTVTRTKAQPHFQKSLRGASERIKKNFVRIAKRRMSR